MVETTLLALAAFLSAEPRAVDKHPPPVSDFLQRVAVYMKTRDEAARQIPALKKDAEPAEIAAYRDSLGKRVRQARNGAKQGDIFNENVAAYFVGIFRSEFRGPLGDAARETIKEGNPTNEKEPQAVSRLRVSANAVYPTDQPVSSMPPTLLLRLPKLPEGLEYRFVARHFIIRDAEANLIVDFIPAAIPVRK